jgi:hypothetical protein
VPLEVLVVVDQLVMVVTVQMLQDLMGLGLVEAAVEAGEELVMRVMRGPLLLQVLLVLLVIQVLQVVLVILAILAVMVLRVTQALQVRGPLLEVLEVQEVQVLRVM